MKFKNFYRILSIFAILGVIGNSQTYATTLDEEALVSNSITSIDNVAPAFDENTESLYYIHNDGVILDSNYNRVEALPRTLTAIDSAGAYSGIGVYMGVDEEGNILLLEPIEGSPAEKVIVPNDILIAVNGEDIRGQDVELVASKIRGQEQTDVNIVVVRDGVELPITINRQIITLYEDNQECIAVPDVDIDSIDTQTNGVIEITYTATDAAGNTATFVIKVVLEIEDTVLYVDTKETEEEEKTVNDTTSGNPPENYEMPDNVEDETEVKEEADKAEEVKDETTTKETTIEEVKADVVESTEVEPTLEVKEPETVLTDAAEVPAEPEVTTEEPVEEAVEPEVQE